MPTEADEQVVRLQDRVERAEWGEGVPRAQLVQTGYEIGPARWPKRVAGSVPNVCGTQRGELRREPSGPKSELNVAKERNQLFGEEAEAARTEAADLEGRAAALEEEMAAGLGSTADDTVDYGIVSPSGTRFPRDSSTKTP